MNYFELHNFYEDKKIHSNINYTFRKYTPIKKQKARRLLSQENDESFLNIIVKHCCFFESK